MAAVFDTDKPKARNQVFDRAAICVSGLCLVQCLLLPILVVVTPLASVGFLGDEWFHMALLLVVLPLSLLAFALGFRQHRNPTMLIPGGLGLLLVALAAAAEISHSMSHWQAALLTSLGGLLLITGHWLNLRYRRLACLR